MYIFVSLAMLVGHISDVMCKIYIQDGLYDALLCTGVQIFYETECFFCFVSLIGI